MKDGVYITLCIEGTIIQQLFGPYSFNDEPCYADAVLQARATADIISLLAEWQEAYCVVRCLIRATGAQ